MADARDRDSRKPRFSRQDRVARPLARECGIIFAGYPHSTIPSFHLETGLKVLQSDEGFLELALPNIDSPYGS